MDVEEQGRRKNPTPRVNTEDDWVCVAQYILPTTVCSTERLRKLQIDLLSVTTYLTWHDKQQRRAPHSHLVATFSPCPSSIHLCCRCFRRRRLFPGMTQFLPEHVRPIARSSSLSCRKQPSHPLSIQSTQPTTSYALKSETRDPPRPTMAPTQRLTRRPELRRNLLFD